MHKSKPIHKQINSLPMEDGINANLVTPSEYVRKIDRLKITIGTAIIVTKPRQICIIKIAPWDLPINLSAIHLHIRIVEINPTRKGHAVKKTVKISYQ